MQNSKTNVASVLADAAALEAQGCFSDALAQLHAAPQFEDDPALGRRLVRLRQRAFREVIRSRRRAGAGSARRQRDVSLPIEPPPPATLTELTPMRVRELLYRNGCIHLPGLVPSDLVKYLVETVDRGFAAYDAYVAQQPHPEASDWFDPFLEINGGMLVRGWARDCGGVLAADSPNALERLLRTYEGLGIEHVIAGYFGERPAVSADKTTLRRTEKMVKSGWHQDGRFLGTNIRSLNVWIALTDCGIDAPSLDIVPTYPDRILETGTGDASFDWTIDHGVVVREFGEESIWYPNFQAGDALLFDHMLVHRTGLRPVMTRSRYALETWFFAPSAYPADQTPLLV